MYVDPGRGARERERVLFGEWTCVGRRDDLGLDEPGRLAVVDVLGESVLLTRDEDGPCTRRTTSAGTGARSCAGAAGRRAGLLGRRGAALPVPLLDLRAGRPAAAGAAHRGRRRRPGRRSRCTPSAWSEWGGFVFVHLDAGRGGAVRRRRRAGRREPWPTTRWATLVTGLRSSYDVAANWKVLAENYNECYHCGPGAPRAVPAGAGVRRRRHRHRLGRRGARTARAPGRSRCPARRPRRRCPAWTRPSGRGTRASWSTRT